jgi:hypothetical protein
MIGDSIALNFGDGVTRRMGSEKLRDHATEIENV